MIAVQQYILKYKRYYTVETVSSYVSPTNPSLIDMTFIYYFCKQMCTSNSFKGTWSRVYTYIYIHIHLRSYTDKLMYRYSHIYTHKYARPAVNRKNLIHVYAYTFTYIYLHAHRYACSLLTSFLPDATTYLCALLSM